MPRPKADPSKANAQGEKILPAIARHHALSKEQLILAAGYQLTSVTHIEEHLTRLVNHRFLQKVVAAEKNIPDHYFLGAKGVQFLHDAGVSVDERTHHKSPTGSNLSHRYWVTWVLVQLEQSESQILECRNEWQLTRTMIKVTLPSGEKVGYAPDLWVKLLHPGEPEPYSIAFEVDRGSEHQDQWRRKIQEMIAFTSRDPHTGVYPFQDLFGVKRLRFAIAVVPGIIGSQSMEDRARNLKLWTELELAKQKKPGWANLMFLRPMDPSVKLKKEGQKLVVDPSSLSQQQLFFDPCWVHPGESTYVPLIGGSA